MRFNPITRRYSITREELAEVAANAVAEALGGISAAMKRDFNRSDSVMVKDITRELDRMALEARTTLSDEIRRNLRETGRFR